MHVKNYDYEQQYTTMLCVSHVIQTNQSTSSYYFFYLRQDHYWRPNGPSHWNFREKNRLGEKYNYCRTSTMKVLYSEPDSSVSSTFIANTVK